MHIIVTVPHWPLCVMGWRQVTLFPTFCTHRELCSWLHIPLPPHTSGQYVKRCPVLSIAIRALTPSTITQRPHPCSIDMHSAGTWESDQAEVWVGFFAPPPSISQLIYPQVLENNKIQSHRCCLENMWPAIGWHNIGWKVHIPGDHVVVLNPIMSNLSSYNELLSNFAHQTL